MDERDIERLVAAAVQAVLEQLRGGAPLPARGPLLRVLIGDADDGLDFALASLGSLPAGAFRLDYLAPTADAARLRRLAEQVGAPVRAADEAGCPRALAREAEAVVAATVDRATAVRVMLTAPECWASRLLFETLLLGKPLILALDAMRLEAPEAPSPLRHALAEPVDRLTAFGAEWADARDLAAVIQRAVVPAPAGGGRSQPLITAADVDAAEGELVVPPGALLTPLALDRARERGIKLRHVPH